MKFIMFVLTICFLTSCGPGPSKEVTNEVDLPEGMRDCTVFVIDYKTIFRCPNSQVSAGYSSGKSHFNISVIEDEVKAKEEDLDTSKKKLEALKKLNEEDKQALGIK